jgi:signal peptidase II
MKQRISYLFLVVILLAADQFTKLLVVRNIPPNSGVDVIRDYFTLVHVQNKGAIFGFFSQSQNTLVYLLLTMASLAALTLVVYYFFKTPAKETTIMFPLSLILAGALGNLSDRVFRGYVIDFLDFSIRSWHWPSFNVADSCITIGAILFIYVFFFRRQTR